MRLTRLILLAASISLMALWGCSSSMDSAGDKGGGGLTLQEIIDSAGEFIGALRCIECHSGFSWSADDVQAYLESPHVIHDDDINAESADDCLDCHDPLGDGPLLEGYINPADVPDEGLAAVTCEVCHGSGIDHYGIGPIPNPTPDYTTCGECHDEDFPYDPDDEDHDHATAYGVAGIVNDYVASSHFEADGRNEPRCVKCHNDEGARAYKNVHTAEQLYALALPLDGEVSPVQCRTCHNPHNPEELLLGESEIELPLADDEYDASAQYATCTNCHQPADAQLVSLTYKAGDIRGTEGDLKTYSDWVDDMNEVAALGITDDQNYGDLIYHAARFGRVISSTHWDNPITNDDSPPEMIEGYVVDPTSEDTCTGCHNQHTADITINRQWAGSGHGGHILQAKEDSGADDHALAGAVAIRMTGSHSAWSANIWSLDDEAECQRCHTATGARSFLNGPTAYYTAINAFIAAEDIDSNQTAVTSPNDYSYLIEGQGELLFCWACHLDNVGTIRNPGSVWLQDRNGDLFGPVPDIGNSNVCAGCHGGRANSTYIYNTDDAARSSSGRIHHLPAAATLFAANTLTGYQFPGLDYDVSLYLQHDLIGRNFDSPETGIGPCASCHMEPGADHHFEAKGLYINDLVTTEDSAAVISASAAFVTHKLVPGDTFTITNGDDKGDYLIDSVDSETQVTLDADLTDDNTGIEAVAPAAIANQALCNLCHGSGMNYTVLQTLNSRYQNLLDYVDTVISGDNYVGSDFDNSTFIRGRGDGVSGKNDYGALQNYEFTRADGGEWGYVHNSRYIRLIIFDTLDWLDDGEIDGSIIIPDDDGWDDGITWLGGNVNTGVVNRTDILP